MRGPIAVRSDFVLFSTLSFEAARRASGPERSRARFVRHQRTLADRARVRVSKAVILKMTFLDQA
jgi:hypothetical protein